MNPMILSALAAILPGIAVLILVSYRSSNRAILFRAFAVGYFVVVPALALELLLSPLFDAAGPTGDLLRAYLVTGLVEDAAKLAAIGWFVCAPGVDSRDRLRVAAVTGMGFATFENLLYVDEALSTLVLRAVTAVPLHLLVSLILVHTAFPAGAGRPRLATALVTAVLIHGTYDLLLFLPSPFPFGAAVVVCALIPVGVRIVRRAS